MARKTKSENKKVDKNQFPIVGIGASAGGLENFEIFFKKMPADSNIAFVVISHLHPEQHSLLSELLGRYTSMKVVEITDKMEILPDHVYIIAPKKNVSILNNLLYLSPIEDVHGLRMPIDFFFRSLADNQKEKAICILLSGSGSDGTLGLKAIHGVGGISMVQDPETAKYISMPLSAVQTGMVDFILPVEQMPDVLMNYVKNYYPKVVQNISTLPEDSNAIQKVLILLRSRTGHDFTQYKKSTILRRIERRMDLHEIKDPMLYLRYLQEHNDEVTLLFNELLIGVTSFFRDPEAFEYLKTKVFPTLFEGRSEKDEIRVWIPGCATGEEVFSIAILFKEYFDDNSISIPIQIFGTDINESAINYARTGLYPFNIAMDVSPERLEKYFTKENNNFKIKKSIRELTIFAVQNVSKDAPFTKLDFISCRNLMIYFDNELQNNILRLFHFSLKYSGFLFMGTSESIGTSSELFTTVDKRWKVYQKKDALPAYTDTKFMTPRWIYSGNSQHIKQERKNFEYSVDKIAQQVLLTQYAPPSVIINELKNVLYIHGSTGKFLEPAMGNANFNIINMAKAGIKDPLDMAINMAGAQKKKVQYSSLKIKDNDNEIHVNISVTPINEPDTLSGFFLVSFDEIHNESKTDGEDISNPDNLVERNLTIEQELMYVKENLQATIEELQSSNEELKSTNEELQSTNEELQSTNEELESSKEELQSVNEELVTVNAELQSKIELISKTEHEMSNLLNSTSIATIFLDNNFNVKKFTPEATKIYNLIPSDIGRPINHIVPNLDDVNIIDDVKPVLDTLVFKEKIVKSKKGITYLMRVMPYRTIENSIEGTVITFVSVDKILVDKEKA